jgi:hypothetical protein
MKHTILTVLLTLGVVGGLASGFHHCRMHGGHEAHWERKVQHICADALREAKEHELSSPH